MRRILIILAVVSLTTLVAPAEVADSGQGGFTVKIATTIHAGPEEVYDRLLKVVSGESKEPQSGSGESRGKA